MAGIGPIHLWSPEEYAAFIRAKNERANAVRASVLELVGVREYAEGYAVSLIGELPSIPYNSASGFHPAVPSEPRLCVEATNEGGYNSVAIDLVDLLDWLAQHRAELLEQAVARELSRRANTGLAPFDGSADRLEPADGIFANTSDGSEDDA